MTEAEILSKARELLELEAKAVKRCAGRISPAFARAVELLERAHQQGKKIVLTGVGKSHYVAAKLSASFMSTGVTAIFVHPVEAFHGDLGVIQPGDPVLLFSKSGATPELLSLIPFLRGRNPLVVITANLDSPIAAQCDLALDASVEKEACPINLLPTASTTVALAMGDALVSVLAEKRGFTREAFAGFHPGGSIGKRLTSKVAEIYSPLEKIAFGPGSLTLQQAAQAMNDKPLGAFCVVDAKNKLRGIVTDGDLRRAVARGEKSDQKIESFMHAKPITVALDMVLEDAIACMEQPKRRVTCAPVVSPMGELLGLVHIHDLI